MITPMAGVGIAGPSVSRVMARATATPSTAAPTAATTPRTALGPSRNGTASGISAPRMPVVEAKADTMPPT